MGVVQNKTDNATSSRCRTSRKNAVLVARMRAMPIVNITWSARKTGNKIIGADSGTWYQISMTGRNTETVSKYWARLNNTVPIGSMARGKRTLLRSPALSTIEAVDMDAELAKNAHEYWPSIR